MNGLAIMDLAISEIIYYQRSEVVTKWNRQIEKSGNVFDHFLRIIQAIICL